MKVKIYMAKIILVHGMAANEKSWFEVPNYLQAEKHSVKSVRLPGHNQPFLSPSAPNIKMVDYVSEVIGHLPKSGESVILIGHSMGGQVITHVAVKHPDRIDRLIYLAAMLPQDGESANDIIEASNINPVKSTLQLAPYIVKYGEVFASQPKSPLNEKLKLPDANDGNLLKQFNSIKRYYILCSKDDVLPSAHQNIMLNNAGISSGNFITIKSDHIPQKSNSIKLNAALKRFINAV